MNKHNDMPNISFVATKEEMGLFPAVLRRARALGFTRDSLNIEMDILATHANGCPLDIGKLMAFDDFNFIHDVGGIIDNLDRGTGHLMGCFLPRCARTEVTR